MFQGMFDPEAAKKRKEGKRDKREAQHNIKQWVLDALSEDMRADVETVSIREVACGDPNCSPVDTTIQIIFKEAGKRPMVQSIPMECEKVTQVVAIEAVEEMLQAETGPEFDPISPQASQVYEGIITELFARMDDLSFSDRMGVCQRVFLNIEEYEQRVLQYQAQMMRRNQQRQNPQHNMLLSYAQQNKPDEIQRLLDAGGLDASAGNSVGQTALHVACLWGNAEAAICLISNNANVNKTNSLTGGSPLHITVTSPKDLQGRLRCIESLLDAGADPNLKDSRGVSALQYATEAASNEPEILDIIRMRSPSVVSLDDFFSAAGNGGEATVAAALCHEQFDAVNEGDDRDHGCTALIKSAKRGRIGVVELLLADRRTDPNVTDRYGNTALHHAVSTLEPPYAFGNSAVVEALLADERTDPNCRDGVGQTPLIVAVDHGVANLVEILLLNKQVDPNMQADGSGSTALMVAATNESGGIMEILLACERLDPNFVDTLGCSALSYAMDSSGGSSESPLVKLLFDDPRLTSRAFKPVSDWLKKTEDEEDDEGTDDEEGC